MISWDYSCQCWLNILACYDIDFIFNHAHDVDTLQPWLQKDVGSKQARIDDYHVTAFLVYFSIHLLLCLIRNLKLVPCLIRWPIPWECFLEHEKRKATLTFSFYFLTSFPTVFKPFWSPMQFGNFI